MQAGGETTDGNRPFTTITTSYDFNAPIDESGTLTPRYYAYRQVIERMSGHKVRYQPPPSRPMAYYGRVAMKCESICTKRQITLLDKYKTHLSCYLALATLSNRAIRLVQKMSTTRMALLPMRL